MGPTSDGITRSDLDDTIGHTLDYSVRTSLRHLAEIDIVEEFRKPGPSVYVIAEWHEDTFIMGDVDGAASEGIEALIEDIQNDDPVLDDTSVVADGVGTTLRDIVADAFDVRVGALEPHLRRGDPVDKLNVAVKAIEKSDEYEVKDDYGEIEFINAPYRYRLTESAITLYEK